MSEVQGLATKAREAAAALAITSTGQRNRALLAMGRLGVTRPYLVLILFLAGTLVLGFNISRLHFSHNELHYFSEDSDFNKSKYCFACLIELAKTS